MLCDKIRKKESALCKLRKKCWQNLKFVSDVKVDTLTEDISTSLNAEGIRLLKGIFRNSKCMPKGRRWNFEDKMLALSLLKRSPKSYSFLRLLLPLPSRHTLPSILITVHFAAGISVHVFGAHQHSLQKCLIETGTVVSCLMKCQSERMSVSFRSLTVLRFLRTMEQRGLAGLQIMLSFSWSVVCIESGSNQLLNTSYVESLRLTCL